MPRKKGSRNAGFWYRRERNAWYAGQKRLLVNGKPIHGEANKEIAHKAYCDLVANGPAPVLDGYTVSQIVDYYLSSNKTLVRPNTYDLRERFCNDFCKYYGDRSVETLKGKDLDDWFRKHPGWNGSKKIAFQSVRRSICYCKSKGMCDNPFKGYKVETTGPGRRVAYFSKSEEAIILETATPSLGDVIRAMIGTGARPGEIATLRRHHCKDFGGHPAWILSKEDHKTGDETGKRRKIPVGPSIEVLVHNRLLRGGDVVFTDHKGRPWNFKSMKTAFKKLRVALKNKGLVLTPDQTLYAARHTYAKRMYPILGEVVTARNMGNSVKVCREIYADAWDDETDNAPLQWNGLV